jgi:hypothetical protein
MQCHGPKHRMGNMFNAHNHLPCQNNTTICGRLIDFLWPLSSHHWRFLLLIMDKFKIFYVTRFQIENNMKLQLGISQLTFAWILSLWFQVHQGNKGNGCHVNTWIIYYNNVMFCGQFEIFIHFLTWSCDEVCHMLGHSFVSM